MLVSKSLDDTDFEQDVEMLHSKLKLSLQDLRYTCVCACACACVRACVCVIMLFSSSFDEYATEVRSGRLEWSPVHRSDKFWVS